MNYILTMEKDCSSCIEYLNGTFKLHQTMCQTYICCSLKIYLQKIDRIKRHLQTYNLKYVENEAKYKDIFLWNKVLLAQVTVFIKK